MSAIKKSRVWTASSSVWTAENPVLPDGFLGFEVSDSDTDSILSKGLTYYRIKIGDGSTRWNSLSYTAQAQTPTEQSAAFAPPLSGDGVMRIGASKVMYIDMDLLSNTGIDAPNLTEIDGINTYYAQTVRINECINATYISMPALTTVTGAAFEITENTLLETVDLGAFTTSNNGYGEIFYLSIRLNNALTTIDISAYASSAQINFSANPLLSTVLVAPVFNPTNINMSGCALSATTVNSILAALVAAGKSTGTVNLSGGTSSAPTGQGLTDKATLQSRSWTVTTN